MKVTLRDYQIKIVSDLRRAFQCNSSVLLVSPTGSGKTVIFSYITEKASQRGKRVYILVHRRELLQQCSDALDELGVEHGTISPKHSMTACNIQVASVQTLVRRLDKVKPPDLLVLDECHHARAKSFSTILEYYPPPRTKLLGVTATPLRLDNKGLGVSYKGHFDVLVHGPTVKELIKLGYLSQPIVYAPPINVPHNKFHTKFGDYDKKEIMMAYDKPKIIGDTVKHYIKMSYGEPAIAFCATVQHAQHVCERFNDAGIDSEFIEGNSSDYHRKYCIEGLADGRIKVLTSCEIISEGIDIPVVRTAILLRPTKSTGLYLQQCGRCMRPYSGKPNAIILDHVGNVFTHGLPDLERHWTLAGTVIKPREAGEPVNWWQCAVCFALNDKTEDMCIYCGADRETRSRIPEEIAGELRIIEEEREEKHRKEVNEYSRRHEVASARTIEELYEIADKRGYKRGWADIIFESRKEKYRKYA